MPVTPMPPVSSNPIVQSGRWDNTATWASGKVPVDGDVVEIPAGKVIQIGSATANLGGLTINGALEFAPDSDVSITSRWIMVNGKLQAGSEAAPFTRRATITLTGADKSQNVMNMGTKLIGVMEGGSIGLHGENRLGWTQLAATASPGATSIALKDAPSTWRAGDKIVIAPSGFEAEEFEVVSITSISANTVNFTPALKYSHWGQLQTIEGKTLDQRAAVGLLSRNIVIQGDAASDAINFGGHVMVMQGGKARVNGVEFFKMGQRGIKGRYPFHWHLAGDLAGDYLKNNAIHASFQRAIVVHGTNNALVEGNVAFDITNHAFVWAEDGNEQRNQFIKNLAIFNKNPKETEFAFPIANDPLHGNSSQAEFRSASFWGRGFNHTIKGNIAAGSIDGFGFFFDRFSPNTLGATEGVGLVFEDNVAHSNYRPSANGVAAEIYPEATFGHGLMVTSNLAEKTQHLFKNFTSYKNYGGAWLEDRSTQLQNSIMSDNGVGIYVHRGVIDGVVVVSKSANTIGNAEIPPKGGFGSPAKGAIVVPSSHGGARAPVILDATIVNFEDTAYVVDVSDLGYSARVEKLKLVNTNRAVYFHEVNPYEYTFDDHGVADVLGSLNGGTPAIWAGRRSPLVSSQCKSNADKNAFSCPLDGAVLLRYKNAPARTTYLVQPSGSTHGLGQPWYFDAQLSQDVNSGWLQAGGQYEVLTAANDNLASDIELYLEYAASKSLELSWASSGASTKLTQNGVAVPAALSLSAMRASSASSRFYDSVQQKLFVKIVGAAGLQTISMQAPLTRTKLELLGRANEALQNAVPGLVQTAAATSADSGLLRQPVPSASGEAKLNIAALSFSNSQALLPSGNGTQVLRAYVNAPADGIYTLSAPGVGGNIDVFVGNAWVTGSRANIWSVVNEPTPAARDESGLVSLRKGWHSITVVFGKNQLQSGYTTAPRLALRWALPGTESHNAISLYRAP